MYRVILILILLLNALNLNADISLNGAYEGSIDLYRDSNNYKWELSNPWNRVELRLWTKPVDNGEFYIKTYGDSWNTVNNYERHDGFYLDETHIKYKIGKSKDNIESYLFYREVKFWLGDPLLNLVNNDYDKWGDKSVSGFTVDINGYLPGFYMKVFGARLYNSAVDGYGIRIYEKILKNILHFGATGTYKKWQGSVDNYNFVYAGDIWANILKTYLTVEFSQSKTPVILNNEEDNIAYKIELRRTLDFASVGEFSLIGSYRDFGKNFRAYLSKDFDNNSKFDRKGFYFESKYKVPYRAITLLYHLDYWRKHYQNYSVMDNYFEIYIKFIKGFRWKSSYQRYSEYDWDKVTITTLTGETKTVDLIDNTWQHFFTQLEMENDLAYVKVQFKAKNMFTEYLKYLYGVEYSINITSKFKSLNRLIIADEIYRTRYTFFSQIQYRYSDNVNVYLGYGNENDSNDDLVNDDNFVESNNNIEHKIHLYVKAGF